MLVPAHRQARAPRGLGWAVLLPSLALVAPAACQSVLGLDEGKPRPEATGSSGGGVGGSGGEGGGGIADTSCHCVLLLGGGGTTIIAGEFRNGKGWTVHELPGATTTSAPALAISAEGQGVGLLRLAGATEATPLRFTTWTSGVWGSIAPMGPQGSSLSEPALSVGAAGVHAVFQGGDYHHLFALFGGVVWSPDAEAVGGFASHSYGPNAADIAAQGAEATVAFMNGSIGPEQNHLFAQRRSEGVWETAQHLTADADFEIPPRIVALNDVQDALIVYVQAMTHQLVGMRRQNLTWGVPEPIGLAFTAQRPALTPVADGGAVLAYRGIEGKLHVARYNGVTWDAAELVPGPDGATIAAPPAMAPGVDDAEVELVYADAAGSVYHLRAERRGWTGPSPITSRTALSLLALASAP